MSNPEPDPDERFSLDMEPEEALAGILRGEGVEEVSEEPQDGAEDDA